MNDALLKISKDAGEALTAQEWTMATAESCTGGAVLSCLTDIPGSSRYVLGGMVAYSNQVKMNRLDVKKETLNRWGAVSKPVALQMARQVADLMKADIGISTTGIAGPGGGSKQKPVGTVWLGFWTPEIHVAIQPRFTGNRLQVKQQTVEQALKTVQQIALGREPLAENLKLYFANE